MLVTEGLLSTQRLETASTDCGGEYEDKREKSAEKIENSWVKHCGKILQREANEAAKNLAAYAWSFFERRVLI